MACTLDAFVDEVCRIFAADPADLKRRAGLLEQRSGSGQRAGAPAHYVCGDYAAYSNAWSPYFRDQLIRGSILIEPGRGNRFAARYREVLPSGSVELTGPGILVGWVLHLELHEAGSGAPVYVSIFLSGRPASVLPGVASGATLAGPDPLPSATRIVLIRVPDGTGAVLERSNQYLAPEASAIQANLAAAGIRPADPQAAAAELRAFLQGDDRKGVTHVSQAAHTRLAGAFDPVAPQAQDEREPVCARAMSPPSP